MTCTAFEGTTLLASGARALVVVAVKHVQAQRPSSQVLIFDDATGKEIDFDLRGTDEQVAFRLGKVNGAEPARGPGRPKLGVVAREVTLMPRHWEWLASRPGGASVTLRKLVDEARRASTETDRVRDAKARAYAFMSAMAVNFPGFEEAVRALFAGERERFDTLTAPWPEDVRHYSARLAFDSSDQQGS